MPTLPKNDILIALLGMNMTINTSCGWYNLFWHVPHAIVIKMSLGDFKCSADKI